MWCTLGRNKISLATNLSISCKTIWYFVLLKTKYGFKCFVLFILLNHLLDWCQLLNKFLRDQLAKIIEYHHTLAATQSAALSGALPGLGPLPAAQSSLPPEIEHALNLWQYNCKLVRYLYQVNIALESEVVYFNPLTLSGGWWFIDNILQNHTSIVKDTRHYW